MINFFALLLANYQAFRTRRVKSVLSESKYIAITVASITQAALVGFPVLLLVDEEPRAHYVVQVLLVFCVCMAVIGFIFVPKVLAHDTAIESMDARSSNLGSSLRASMRSRSFKDSRNSGVVNDTVAQIRAAAESFKGVSMSSVHFEEPDGGDEDKADPEAAPPVVSFVEEASAKDSSTNQDVSDQADSDKME